MPLSMYQDRSMHKDITDDLQLNIGLIADFEACHLYASEAYAGTLVGQTCVWSKELGVATLLASARLLEWDYLIGLENGF